MNKIYGLGIADLKDSKNYPGWKAWVGILKRVSQSKGSYKDVEICEEWLTFSNFNSWYEKHHKSYWHIDKDLMGHKLYSPETCVYLPELINYLLIRIEPYKKTDEGFVALWHLGGSIKYSEAFETEEEAILEHVELSKNNMRYLVSLYKYGLSTEVQEKLLNYDFLET